jgi:hypothetical protein
MAAVAAVVSPAATAAVLLAGPGASAGPVVAALAVAYGGLAVAVLFGSPLRRRTVLGLGAVLLLLAVVRPPTGSHDVWSYAMYGRIAAQHGASPYVHPPNQFPTDPILARVDHNWRNSRSVYGPLFTAWSAGWARLAGSSALLLRLGFQLTAAAAVAVGALLLDRRTRGDPRVLALVLLNPLVVCSLVNDAHVDAVAGVLVLGAVLLAQRSRHGATGVVMGLAILVKAIALVPAGALGLWLLAGRRFRPAVRYAVAVLVVAAAGYLAGGGAAALRPLAASSNHLTRASVWGPARQELVEAQVDRGVAPERARQSVGRALGLVASLLVIGGTVVLVLTNGSRAGPAAVAGGAVLAYMLLGAYVYPWYAGVGLFAIALFPRWPPTWIFLTHAALLQLAEVPGFRFFHPVPLGTPAPWSWHVLAQRWVLPPIELLLVVALVLTIRRGMPTEQAAA